MRPSKLAALIGTILFVIIEQLALATDSIGSKVMEAACRSQAYLQKNGYLDHIDKYDPDTLHLDILDRMRGGPDGDGDIRKILDAREGSFKNKLFGVWDKDGIFNVIYRFTEEDKVWYRGVMVSSQEKEPLLVHQDMLPPDQLQGGELTQMTEKDLNCSA